MLLTADYLRMDDGMDGGDYILYDRNTREVAAVSHVNRSVLKIYHHEVAVQPPIALDYAERSEVDPNAPQPPAAEPEVPAEPVLSPAAASAPDGSPPAVEASPSAWEAC